jgi:methylenetetrahydrofolate dehydrogenase (NADP+)/methenyltetrahydrofolate cyclohydrolase
MPAEVIDGKAIAAEVRDELREDIRALKEKGITPSLAAVVVGDDPSVEVYARMKKKACEALGIEYELRKFPEDVTEGDLLLELEGLHQDRGIHGILVQFPIPPHLSEEKVILSLDPAKDVDGLHPRNVGLLLLGKPRFVPATPAGVVELLHRSGHPPNGKHAVILGRSNVVGKPLAALLMQKSHQGNATVTVCHTGTPNPGEITRTADILIAAAGVPRLVRGDMIRPGAVVVDVGVNQVPDSASRSGYRLVGDVHFEEALEVAGAITPVPGGVGPMTIAMLLQNTVRAAAQTHG